MGLKNLIKTVGSYLHIRFEPRIYEVHTVYTVGKPIHTTKIILDLIFEIKFDCSY